MDCSLDLWYRAPASHWNEALPVGNGSLGGMVFGDPYRERIALNVDTLWAGGVRDRVNPKALEALPNVRRLIFEGRQAEAMALAKECLMGIPDRIESYEPLGDLNIAFAWQGGVTGYRRGIDLSRGLAVTRLVKDDIPCLHEVFSSHPDKVMVVRLRSFHAERRPYALELWLDRQANASCRVEGGDLILEGRTDAGLSFAARVRTLGAKAAPEPGPRLATPWSKEIAILLAAETSMRGLDPLAAATERLDAAERLGADALQARHEADYQALFARHTLELEGPDLSHLSTEERMAALRAGVSDPRFVAAAYQFRRYMQICSSRPGTLPSNLQGIWNDKLNAPWNSDFHANINLQMNYWPHERGNLPETILPLVDWLESIIPSGERTAKLHYGCRGWVLHHVGNPWGCTTPCDGVQGVWPLGGAWLAQHLWWHYQFSGDRGFLARRAWPILKGAARFLMDFLVEAPPGTPVAGRMVTNPSHSPENAFRLPDGRKEGLTYMATMDIGIIIDCLGNCAAAAAELGVDAAFAEECRSMLARIPGYQISARHGGIQEWIEDYEEVEPGHRHISHLFGLFPGASIDRHAAPGLAAAARRSIERRMAHQSGIHQKTGWALGWLSCLWARLGDGDMAWRNIVECLARASLPNLMTDAHGHPQVADAHGIAMGLLECLVQDHNGTLEILPALPMALPAGRATGLRLRGGHTADLAWSGGRLRSCRLTPGCDGAVAVRKGAAVETLAVRKGVPVELA